MSKRIVLFCYNLETSMDERALLVFIKNMRGIESWTQPYPGIFFLLTEAEIDALSERLGEFLGKHGEYFITPAGDQGHGVLAEQSWEWFFSKSELIGEKLADYGTTSEAFPRIAQTPSQSGDDE